MREPKGQGGLACLLRLRGAAPRWRALADITTLLDHSTINIDDSVKRVVESFSLFLKRSLSARSINVVLDNIKTKQIAVARRRRVGRGLGL